jgi:ribosomal-protein-alanine N-acetyltransferase
LILPGDDLDRIMAVMQTAFAPEYGEAWNRRQVEDALLIGSCHYALVAEHGEPPEPHESAAGFYLARDGYEEAELLLLGVDPAHRRKGLGRNLLNRFAETSKANGAQRLLLEMRRGNPAEALYRGFGFAQIGERPNYYRTRDGNSLDALTLAYPCG